MGLVLELLEQPLERLQAQPFQSKFLGLQPFYCRPK